MLGTPDMGDAAKASLMGLACGGGAFVRSVIVREGRWEVQMQGWDLGDALIARWCDWAQENLQVVLQRCGLPLISGSAMVALEVNVASNRIGDRGLHILLKTLHELRVGVQVLKVFRNNLGRAAACVLADWISSSAVPLLELHMSHNYVPMEGAICIFEAVARNPKYPPERPDKGTVPLWLRLENNIIARSQELIPMAEARMKALRAGACPQGAQDGLAQMVCCVPVRARGGCNNNFCWQAHESNRGHCPLVHATYHTHQRECWSVPREAAAWSGQRDPVVEAASWSLGFPSAALAPPPPHPQSFGQESSHSKLRLPPPLPPLQNPAAETAPTSPLPSERSSKEPGLADQHPPRAQQGRTSPTAQMLRPPQPGPLLCQPRGGCKDKEQADQQQQQQQQQDTEQELDAKQDEQQRREQLEDDHMQLLKELQSIMRQDVSPTRQAPHQLAHVKLEPQQAERQEPPTEREPEQEAKPQKVLPQPPWRQPEQKPMGQQEADARIVEHGRLRKVSFDVKDRLDFMLQRSRLSGPDDPAEDPWEHGIGRTVTAHGRRGAEPGLRDGGDRWAHRQGGGRGEDRPRWDTSSRPPRERVEQRHPRRGLKFGPRAWVGNGRITGVLVKWMGRFQSFGWIEPDERIDHPLAELHRGQVFLLPRDAERKPSPGARVSFYLYSDSDGLGAEGCRALET
uniref:Uncharacterized protein n=1 Tax=Alexandrium monilatum TaxID=311494 RepID=A0A7S4REQ7_9DINO